MNQKKLERILFFDLVILLSIVLLLVVYINKEKVVNITSNSFAIIKNKLSGNSVITSKWNSNYITPVTDDDGIIVPVPKGYIASKVDGEHAVKTGFVIYETKEELTEVNNENVANIVNNYNQWVWVPVKDVNRLYTENQGIKKSILYDYSEGSLVRTKINSNEQLEPALLKNGDTDKIITQSALQGITAQELNQMISLQYEEAMNSIKKYGGFYIGRYETGNVGTNDLVVVKNNTDLTNDNWYSMFEKMQHLGANRFVKTNMIFGNLFDETLQWFIDNGSRTYEEIANNSNTWGNFKNAEFDYVGENQEVKTKALNSSMLIPTGTSEYTKNCNIYDLAGNVRELTMESNGNKTRVSRGGDYSLGEDFFGVSSQAGKRGSGFGFSSSGSGYRAFMYIK